MLIEDSVLNDEVFIMTVTVRWVRFKQVCMEMLLEMRKEVLGQFSVL